MYIFLVTALGFLLRAVNIIKPEGLWNDEYVSWFTSSVPFGEGFFHAFLNQCHMPLYYLYLKPFCGMSDTVLRLTSLLPSLLAIPVMYFLGKEHSEKCAKYSAVITSVLPFLVYYSQEVRFYSLIFLISAVVLLFLIRSVKYSSEKNYVFLCIFSLVLIFTHVLGIFYIIILSGYFLYKKRILKKQLLLFCGVCVILVLPLGINILKQLPSSQWWGHFSYTNLLFMFTDFFSPILTNNVNAPAVFFYKKDLFFNFLLLLSPLIAFAGIIAGGRKYKGISISAIIFITLIAVISLSGRLVFITKYVTEILPVLIFIMSAGFADMKKYYAGNILLGAFILVNIAAVFTPFYPSLQTRGEGHRLPAVVLNTKKPDNVIFTYYAPDRFKRYMKYEPKTFYISKINRFDYVNNPEILLKNIKKGESTAVVFLNSVSFVPENLIEEADGKNIPEMFLTFSIVKNRLHKEMLNNCPSLESYTIGSWTVLYCEKYSR